MRRRVGPLGLRWLVLFWLVLFLRFTQPNAWVRRERASSCHSCTPRRAAGIIYLVLKAVAFLLNLVLGIPAVAGVVASLRSTVGL